MSNNLVDVIGEQFDFGFTGRTNILDRNSSQFLGAIYQIDGLIVKCLYRGIGGKKGLYKALHESLVLTTIKHISEPEILDDSIAEFRLTKEQMLHELQNLMRELRDTKKLKPPGHLKLAIVTDFFLSGTDVTAREFDLLKLLTEYAKVSDIYANSDIEETEVTQGLIGLRKKGALAVVSDQ
ncbi:MAG: hypothetical protein HYV97_13255 [Bdellovibrio sp.]|nr:hypothetical protein [Bdellovibrio sp.]